MNFAIITAAGKGKRMKKNANKVFLPLLNKPVLYYTLKVFQECNLIDYVVVVTQKKYTKKIFQMKNFFGFSKIKNIVEGGAERQDSVYNGLKSINNAKNDDIVIVHNGSNPLVKQNEIIDCINAAKQHGAAAAGFKLKDTIKKINNDFVEKTIDRAGVYQIQTPQAAKYSIFADAFKNAIEKNLKVTDDVSLVESIGKKIKITTCSYENIKITTQEDLNIAEAILRGRNNSASFRVGFGQDSHKFTQDKNKKLVLGGCIVPNEIGLDADSDGDVILHALFNAISSAIGGRSLGYYSDEMYRNGVTDSKEYLKVILNKLNQKNYNLNNVSIMIEASKPKLEAHTDKIKDSLSKILNLSEGHIGITYTSGEGLASFGQGVQCFVVVTVR